MFYLMSDKDLGRLEIIKKLKNKQITQKEASKLLKISDRQIRNVLQRYENQGVNGLKSKRFGKASNHRLGEEVRGKVIQFLKEDKYQGFGPTFACEKLIEFQKIKVSVNTVRSLMIENKLWMANKPRPIVVHPLRQRREHFGELIQIDTSHHDWFEERGPRCALIVFIDDATSSLLGLYFAEGERLEAYFELFKKYLTTYGRPLSCYSDRHAIFKTTRKKPPPEKRPTQFARAMQELQIELIYALTPQAKGRVERVMKTLQDRLVKELRLREISDISSANQFINEYIQKHNEKFSIAALKQANFHRSLLSTHNLEKILTDNSIRVIQQGNLFQYSGVFYQVKSKTSLYKEEIMVWEDSLKNVHVEHKGQELQVEQIGKQPYELQAIPEGEERWKSKKTYHPPNTHPYKRKIFKLNFK